MQIVRADGFKKQYAFTHLMKIELSCFKSDLVTRKDFNDNYQRTYFLVDIDQNIIGYYMWYPQDNSQSYHMWYPDRNHAYLFSFAIDKYHQGNGYSKLMLDHFLTNSGYDVHCLHVNPNNKGALYLYNKNGFKQIEETIENFYEDGSPAILMFKVK